MTENTENKQSAATQGGGSQNNNTQDSATQTTTQRKRTFFDLNPQEFAQIFKTYIAPKLKYKNLRARKNLIACIICFIFILMTSVLVFTPFSKSKLLSSFSIGLVLLCLFLLLFLAYVFSVLKKNIIKEESIIKETFFNILGISYDKKSSWLNFTADTNPEIWRLFPPLNQNSSLRLLSGEGLSFTFQNLPINLVDIEGKKSETQAFLILSKTNKMCSKTTIINTKRSGLTYHLFRESLMKEFPIENEAFEQEFSVVSQDIMEASQFLKPDLMLALLKYKRDNDCSIDIVFSGEMSEKYNTFICIIPKNNYFDFKGKYGEAQTYYVFIQELKNLLSLILPLR